jgi:twitching motility protein PilT
MTIQSYAGTDIFRVPEINPRLKQFLAAAIKNKASDLHLQPQAKPYIRIDGKLRALGTDALSEEACKDIILSTLDEKLLRVLEEKLEIDYALNIPEMGRFRVNTFHAQGSYESVIRIVSLSPRSLVDLRIPESVKSLALHQDGLVLVAGSTGSGKSSTLAALIDVINSTSAKRIITIENPVEIIHTNKKSLITQREIGLDTVSFAGALRSALRQDPDVILVGEIRDKETAEAAVEAAQTGHLVFSTIHAGSSEETVIRLANLFPLEDRENIRDTLSAILRGVLVQKLIRDVDDKPLPVVEIMVNSTRMQDAIAGKASSDSIQQIIEESGIHGMQTMDGALVDMVIQKMITRDTALVTARNSQWVQQKLKAVGLN